MNEGEPTKKYDTNPLDKRVAERAEAEMGGGEVETEAPTREMPHAFLDAPEAGGETRHMDRDTGPTSSAPTASAQTPSTAPTRGMYTPPSAEPSPYASPHSYPQGPPRVLESPPPSYPAQAYTPPSPPVVNPNQPYPQSPYSRRPEGGSQALGLKPNFAAMLGYTPLIGIAAAFLFVVLEPSHNRFVRFHAKQALLAHIMFWVGLVFFNVARSVAPGFIGPLLLLPQMAFFVGAIIGFVVMMTKAFAGERTKIPIIGDQAE